MINQRWIYVKRPQNIVGEEHYQLVEELVNDTLAHNEVLLANRYVSVDPYMRIQQAASNTWEAPHPVNELQQSGVVSQVVRSNHNGFQAGDWVMAYTGWEKFSVTQGDSLTLLNPELAPVTASLGVLGMPGRTAWFGLTEAGMPRPGETVVVSGASGAVGSLVVQFAKKAGCKVIAFAGGEDKCHWVKSTLAADLVIDYRDFSNYQMLKDYLTQLNIKVDIYFDNVGGMITDAIIPLINRRARIIICGQMSQYNGHLDQVEQGPRCLHHLLYQRATIQGILARDYTHRMDEMLEKVAPWVKQGDIVFEETIVDGFEKMPQHLASLFERESVGKLIVKVGD